MLMHATRFMHIGIICWCLAISWNVSSSLFGWNVSIAAPACYQYHINMLSLSQGSHLMESWSHSFILFLFTLCLVHILLRPSLNLKIVLNQSLNLIFALQSQLLQLDGILSLIGWFFLLWMGGSLLFRDQAWSCITQFKLQVWMNNRGCIFSLLLHYWDVYVL